MRKIIASILISGLVLGLGSLVGVLVVKAADTTLTQTVTAGALTVSAPASVTFGAVDYSFTGQTSSGNTLDNIQPSDKRGSEAGWTVVATCTDWTKGADTMDYDGNGTTTGQLTINQGSVTVSKTAGQDIDPTNGPIKGTTDSFDAVTTEITILTASASYGEGEYDADGYDLQQYIPGMTNAGDWTTTLTITIS